MLINRECLLSELVKEGNDANIFYANRKDFRAGVAEGLRVAHVIARSECVTPKAKELVPSPNKQSVPSSTKTCGPTCPWCGKWLDVELHRAK